MRHTRDAAQTETTNGQTEIKAIVWALGQVLTAMMSMLARVQLFDDLTPVLRVRLSFLTIFIIF